MYVGRPTYARAVALVVGFDLAQPESISGSMQERVSRRLRAGSNGWPWVLMAEAIGGDVQNPPDLDELSPEQDALAITHLVSELRSLLGIERDARFSVTPWDAIERFYMSLSDGGAAFVAPMLQLTRSVMAEGAAGSLAAHTSMHDLVVTPTPVSSSPDWLRVSLVGPDRVRIEHETPRGPGDSIERPRSDILPLFWRFTTEKWGIRPARDSR
jgi:hypothetical protein